MRTTALSVPPHSVFSPQLSAKRGTPHPGNSEARVSQPCPAHAGKKYHAHSGSFRPAAQRFLSLTIRKARYASLRKFRSAPRFAAFSRALRQEISCAQRLFPPRRPHSVLSQLSAKRGTSHPGNSEARVSQPCPARTGKKYHAHSGSFRPAVCTSFSPLNFPKSAGTPHPGNSEARRVSQPCPANAGKEHHAHSASFRPAAAQRFLPPDYPQSAECLTPEIPKRAAFRSLLREHRQEISCAQRFFPSRRRKAFSPNFPQSAGAGRFLAGRRNPRVLFPTNALEYTPKAHSKQKRR